MGSQQLCEGIACWREAEEHARCGDPGGVQAAQARPAAPRFFFFFFFFLTCGLKEGIKADRFNMEDYVYGHSSC
jgi:hypothetical protein